MTVFIVVLWPGDDSANQGGGNEGVTHLECFVDVVYCSQVCVIWIERWIRILSGP